MPPRVCRLYVGTGGTIWSDSGGTGSNRRHGGGGGSDRGESYPNGGGVSGWGGVVLCPSLVMVTLVICPLPHRSTEWVLGLGANKNARDNGGWTPLHWAAYNSHPRCVQLLLEAGADAGIASNDGSIPYSIGRPSQLNVLHFSSLLTPLV